MVVPLTLLQPDQLILSALVLVSKVTVESHGVDKLDASEVQLET
jgi:hypothetical protein